MVAHQFILTSLNLHVTPDMTTFLYCRKGHLLQHQMFNDSIQFDWMNARAFHQQSQTDSRE